MAQSVVKCFVGTLKYMRLTSSTHIKKKENRDWLLSTSNYIALFRKTAPELHKLNCTDYINKTTELLQTELNSAALN